MNTNQVVHANETWKFSHGNLIIKTLDSVETTFGNSWNIEVKEGSLQFFENPANLLESTILSLFTKVEQKG